MNKYISNVYAFRQWSRTRGKDPLSDSKEINILLQRNLAFIFTETVKKTDTILISLKGLSHDEIRSICSLSINQLKFGLLPDIFTKKVSTVRSVYRNLY
jgi:hypothetical protein